MNTIIIQTAQNIELEYPQANVGERILASMIDFFLLLGYFFLVTQLANGFNSTELWLLMILPGVCYSLVCEILFNGRSLGKFLLNTRVISLDGAAPTISQYMIRWMLRIIDIWMPPFIIGLITISVNKKGQRIGGLSSNTTVIKMRLVPSFADTIFMATDEDYEVRFPQVASLSDKDVRIIKEVLDAGIRRQDVEILYRLSRRVREVTGIEIKMDAKKFLRIVLKDYNHLYGRS